MMTFSNLIWLSIACLSISLSMLLYIAKGIQIDRKLDHFAVDRNDYYLDYHCNLLFTCPVDHC